MGRRPPQFHMRRRLPAAGGFQWCSERGLSCWCGIKTVILASPQRQTSVQKRSQTLVVRDFEKGRFTGNHANGERSGVHRCCDRAVRRSPSCSCRPLTTLSHKRTFLRQAAPRPFRPNYGAPEPPHSGLLLGGTMQRATGADLGRGRRANGREYVAAICANRHRCLRVAFEFRAAASCVPATLIP